MRSANAAPPAAAASRGPRPDMCSAARHNAEAKEAERGVQLHSEGTSASKLKRASSNQWGPKCPSTIRRCGSVNVSALARGARRPKRVARRALCADESTF
jgi:hypothetical protein